MNREFLEKYGLEKEQVDSILDEHSKGIGKAKGDVDGLTTQVEEYKTQLAERDKDIADLSKQTGDSAEMQTEMSELQAKYEADTKALNDKVAETSRNSAVELALTKAGAKNIKAAKALLDMSQVEVTDGSVKGLEEQLTAMQESDGYLFGTGESTGQITASGNATGATAKVETDAMETAMERFL